MHSVLLDDKFTWLILSLEKDSFPTNPGILHSAFYKLRQDFDALDEITFKRTYPSLYSEELDSLLFRMELAGLISCGNPNYQRFGINPDARRKLKERLSGRLPKEMKLVMEEAARGFQTIIDNPC